MSEYARTTNNTPTILQPVIYFRVTAYALALVAVLGTIMMFIDNATVSTTLGFDNTFLNFTWAHNIAHFVLAGAAFLFGFASLPGNTVRLFALIFGVVYLLLGITGFVMWQATSGDELLALTPGLNIVHVLIGGYAIASGGMAKYN